MLILTIFIRNIAMDSQGELSAHDKEILNRTCPVCHKIYSGRSQLCRHLREIHNEYEKYQTINEKDRHIFKCLEGCECSFRLNRDLREHLNSFHGFNLIERTREFGCIEDFNKWFIELQETGVHFIKNQGSDLKKCKNGSRVSYYTCNRSGIQRSRAIERKRKPKKHGSRKINAGCTCFLKLVEFNDKYTATYCDFHYGHKIELEHLPLPFRARAEIVEKLEKGAQIVKIQLDHGGNYIRLNNMQRSKILTSADLKNLKYNTKKGITLPQTVLRKNINVIKPDDTSTTVENDQLEIITIISNDNNIPDDQEDAPMDQNMVLCNSENETEEFIAEELADEESPIKDESDDTTEYLEDTEEDYGQYVADTLQKIEPSERMVAKRQIDEILQRCLLKHIS